MRIKVLKPIFLFIGFVLIVGMACLSSTKADPTATTAPIATREGESFEAAATESAPIEPVPTEAINPQPTFTVSQLNPTEPIEEPTEEVVNQPLSYYTEEFDQDLTGWSYFLMNGDENKMDLYTDNGYLVFDLQGENQWVYLLYDEYTYSSVRIDLLAENKGKNTNNVSLICNYSDRYGWYEFNITNGGLYYIYAYSELDGDYYTLASGGSKNVVTGRASNWYTAICEDNYLALYINGVLEREHTDTVYNLREGKVGLGVSSFDVLPILVEIDYFSIDVPY